MELSLERNGQFELFKTSKYSADILRRSFLNVKGKMG
jgi:hypothetical protein